MQREEPGFFGTDGWFLVRIGRDGRQRLAAWGHDAIVTVLDALPSSLCPGISVVVSVVVADVCLLTPRVVVHHHDCVRGPFHTVIRRRRASVTHLTQWVSHRLPLQLVPPPLPLQRPS